MQDIDNDIKTDQNLSLNEESKNNDKEDHNLYNYPTHYDLLNYINDIYKPNTEPNKICIKEQDIILKALSSKEKSKSNPSIISYNKKILKSIKKSHQKESKNKINIKSEKDIKHKANSISKKEKKNNDSFNWNNIENEWKNFIQTDNEKKFEDINTKINQMANLMNIYADKVSNIDDNINTIMKILLNLNKKKLVSKSKSKSKNNELIGIKKEKDKNYLGKKIKKSEEFKIKEENKEKTNYDKHDKYEPSLKKPDINKSITKASNTSQMKLKEPILYEQNLKIKNNELHKTTNNINNKSNINEPEKKIVNNNPKAKKRISQSMKNYASHSESDDSDYSYNEEVKDEDDWYNPNLENKKKYKIQKPKSIKDKPKKYFRYFFDGHIINNKKAKWEVHIKQLTGWFSLGISERKKTSKSEKLAQITMTVERNFIVHQTNYLITNDQCSISWEDGENKVNENLENFKIKDGDNLTIMYSPKFKQLKIQKINGNNNITNENDTYIIENIDYYNNGWLVPCMVFSKFEDKASIKNFHVLADYNK